MVVAMQWVSRVTTVSLEMVVPPLIGIWLDERFGTTPLITITGAVLGFFVSMYTLLQMAKGMNRPSNRYSSVNKKQSPPPVDPRPETQGRSDDEGHQSS